MSALVSVLMTSYNREQFIAEAIESVLKSTYTNFELIIVDDGSTDRTAEIAGSYERVDSRVKLHINEKNLGQFPNRNHAASFASGEYILYVDSDDKLFADGMKNLVEIMEQFPQSNFGMYAPEKKTAEMLQPAAAIHDHFFKKPFLTHGPGGTIHRRTFFDEIGRYPVDFGIPGDMYFNLKAAAKSPLVLIPFEFVFYRRHEGQEINNTYDYLYNNYKYLNAALNELNLPLKRDEISWLHKKNKRRFVVNISRFFAKTGSLTKTMFAVRQARFGISDFLKGIFH